MILTKGRSDLHKVAAVYSSIRPEGRDRGGRGTDGNELLGGKI